MPVRGTRKASHVQQTLQPNIQGSCMSTMGGKACMLHKPGLQASNLSLLPEQPPLVELKLLAFQDVSITATALSRAGADACIQPASGKLVIQVGVQRPGLVTSL